MNNTYNSWKKNLAGTDDEIALDMMTPEDIEDAFSGNIAFGTGGLRGVMGLGSKLMNHHTIARVTKGFAKAILSMKFPKSVGIAYDTRYQSDEFAKTVSDILAAYGIATYIFDKPMPTPALSFAIRYLKLGWGVVITASHNPQEYNGYKVYESHGVQVTDKIAYEITNYIESVDFFETIPEFQHIPVTILNPDTELAYREQIVSFIKKEPGTDNFPFIYSALHGTGANAIPDVLKKLGFSPFCIQQNPDNAFGGMKTPNPEEPAVYAKALEEAEQYGAKLILATDPDCDRVGVMVKSQKGFELLNGNQIGALLIDYLAQTRGVSEGDTVITTIVSGMLGELISESYGLEFKRLLTGFKYIGEYAVRLPENKHFFFGYEESYGFLAGDGARDKDAVIASAMIVQMTAYYSRMNITLLDRWMELSFKYGFCLEELHSAKASQNKQIEIMEKIRARSWSCLENLEKIDDYLMGLDELPPSDVIKLYFIDGSWAAIRPSGTEPKIKLYTGVQEKTLKAAKAALKSLTGKLLEVMEV